MLTHECSFRTVDDERAIFSVDLLDGVLTLTIELWETGYDHALLDVRFSPQDARMIANLLISAAVEAE